MGFSHLGRQTESEKIPDPANLLLLQRTESAARFFVHYGLFVRKVP